jgi:hypothetical protein
MSQAAALNCLQLQLQPIQGVPAGGSSSSSAAAAAFCNGTF